MRRVTIWIRSNQTGDSKYREWQIRNEMGNTVFKIRVHDPNHSTIEKKRSC